MELVGQILSSAAGIGSLICFILVLVKMFQNGQTVLGIVCIVGVFCCFGGLIAFVYGWMKSSEWGIQTVMLIWTVCIILQIVGGVMAPAAFSGLQGR